MRIARGLTTAALAATFGFAMPALVAAKENILFNCFFPPQHYVCRAFLPELDRRIDEATEGRVGLRVPPKSLAAPPDQYDGVVNGVMDGDLDGFINAYLKMSSKGEL